MDIRIESLFEIRKITEDKIWNTYRKVVTFSKPLTSGKTYIQEDNNKFDLSQLKGVIVTHIEQEEFANRFDDYYNQVLNDALKSTSLDSLLTTLTENMRKTKIRWSDSDIFNSSIIKEECDLVKAFYSLMGAEGDKIKELTSVNNSEEYKSKIIEEIEEWKRDKLRTLGEYRYLQLKDKRQIFFALKNDIKLLVYNFLINELSVDTLNIWSVPNTLGNYPILPSRRSKVDISMDKFEGLETMEGNYVVVDSYQRDNITYQTSFNIAVLKEVELQNLIGNLDDIDVKIIGYLLGLRDERFFRTREIITTIGDIVANVGLSISGSNYIAVRERLFKLRYQQISAIGPDIRGFSASFIDNLEIFKVNGTDRVRVLFNIDVVEQALNNQTINMYGDIMKNFNNPMSVPLILHLQVERIKQLGQGKKSIQISYETFSNYLYLSDRLKARNIKKINDSLQEIVGTMTTVEKITKHGDTWDIEFYEITNQEKRDLFNNLPLQILKELRPKYTDKNKVETAEQLSLDSSK